MFKLSEKMFLIVTLGTIAVIGIIGYLYLDSNTKPIVLVEGSDGTALSFSKLWVLSVLAYTIFSYRFWDPVKLNENAALTLLDIPVADLGPGPAFAPLLITEIKRVTSETIQKEFPDEPHKIFRGDMKDKEGIPEGSKPPIRIQFRDSITEEEAVKLFGEKERIATIQYNGETPEEIEFVIEAPIDGLAKRVTAEPYPVIRFVIESPTLFLRNIGSVDKALTQIEDEMFSVLTRFYPRMSVGQALQNIRWMNAHLYNAVAKRVGIRGGLKPWGIKLQDAYVKYIYTSHKVNTAISEAAQAPFEKEKTIITAEATERRLILEGRGAAQASHDFEKKTLAGRAAGMALIAKELEISGREAQSAEVGRAVAEGGNTFVVGSEGVTQIAAIAAAYAKSKDSDSESESGGSN